MTLAVIGFRDWHILELMNAPVGGGVDKNGIATAVASKPEANVVFVVDVVYDEFSTWKKHFEGFKDETGFPDPSEKVSTGGNHVRVSSNHNTFY